MAKLDPKVVPQPDTHDLAWAAGFFDGEGCFDASAKLRYETSEGARVRRYLRLSVGQKHDPLLQRLEAMFGVGKVYYENPRTGRTFAKWVCNSRSAFHVASLLWPYLGEQKKADFKRAIKAIRETRTDFVRHSQRGTRFVTAGDPHR